MGWKRDVGRGARSRSWLSGDEESDFAVNGVEIRFVCGGIPVLTLDKSSVFNDNVSWMLQTALSSTAKADSLYVVCDDKGISAECRQLGLRDDDLTIASLKNGLRHVKAVGTTGKRSVMMAVVVALALEKGDELGELWKELRAYKLDAPFVEVLQSGQQSASATLSSATSSTATAMDCDDRGDPETISVEGVELDIVCGGIPVVTMDKSSIFSESVSWMLQTALESTGKADALYEYCSDKEIFSACKLQLGLTEQDMGLVRLKRPDLKSVKAVGTNGKRSIMLSVVVSLVLREVVSAELLIREVAQYDKKLELPFQDLIRSVVLLNTKACDGRDGPAAKRQKGAAVGKVSHATPEELKARTERAQRFDLLPAAKAPAGAPDAGRFEEGVPKATSTNEKAVEGTCTDLEKPYLRLTTLPRASDVRPVPVLKQAFALVRERWSRDGDWVYAGEMLRSIRQDLTVQIVRDSFSVEVYEFCARAALEVGDFKQYDQCSTQLEDLHADASLGTSSVAVREFLAYRLLYLALQGDNVALSAFLRQQGGQVLAGIAAGDSLLAHAWGLRKALACGGSARAAKLASQVAAAAAATAVKAEAAAEGAAGGGARRLAGMLAETSRLRLLAVLCRACKPALPRQLLSRLAAGPESDVAGGDALEGLPVSYRRGDPDNVDGPATLAEAERLLARAAGARVRLGEQSTDHVKGFVRLSNAG